MATLADVIRKKRTGGQSRTGSIFGSLKDKLKESIDPRQLINQTGILTALFPSLKAYKAKGVSNDVGKKLNKKSTELISSSAQSTQLSEIDLSVIAINTEIAAKNTMILPNLSRDVNVMRQNISKLVKAGGQKPETKADTYFKKSKDRESEYERQFQKKTPKSPTKISKEDDKDKDDESKSKGFLGIIGKLITSLIGAVVSSVKFVIGSLVDIIKGLLSTLISGLSSLIKTILTKMVGVLFDIIKKIGSRLLSAVGFIRTAVLPFLQRLMMSPAGAALILAALVHMGLQNLAKDYIKGRKNKDRLRELRKLEKEGKLTPEEKLELNARNSAGETVTMSEASHKTPTVTIDPVTVNTLLNDPTRTDTEIKEAVGVSREVLEAYREALANRDIMMKNNIPVPTLQDVATSFGEKIDRSPSTPTQTSIPNSTTPTREETDIRSALEEDYKQSHLTVQESNVIEQGNKTLSPETQSTKPISSAVTNLTQNFNEAKKVAQVDNDVTVLPNSSSTVNSASSSSKKTILPDVINVDYPTFNQSQIIST